MIAALRSRLKASNCSLVNDKLRIDVKKGVGVHRESSEKLVLIDIHAGKPNRVGHLIDAGHLGDAIAVRERQGEDKMKPRGARSSDWPPKASTPAYQAVTTVRSRVKAMTAIAIPRMVSILRQPVAQGVAQDQFQQCHNVYANSPFSRWRTERARSAARGSWVTISMVFLSSRFNRCISSSTSSLRFCRGHRWAHRQPVWPDR